jgi:hypothetical protein
MSALRVLAAAWLVALCGCGGDPSGTGVDAAAATDAGGAADAPVADAPAADGAASDASTSSADAAATDAGSADAAVAIDAAPDAIIPPDATEVTDASPDAALPPDAATGIITGGPCLSGAAGATASRIQWLTGGGTAYLDYEVHGLPDTSRYKAGAYSMNFNYTPAYVDTYLAQGGLQLSGTVFVDIELSTLGLSQIDSATLSIYGRSYNTTASGSFTWQTWDGLGAAPTNLVANSAPYEWYTADMTTEISPGDDGVLLRIRAGPSSNALVVNRIEICMDAS